MTYTAEISKNAKIFLNRWIFIQLRLRSSNTETDGKCFLWDLFGINL